MAQAHVDKKILDLIKTIETQKKDIQCAERPNWKTHCSFSYVEGKVSDQINLHVESDVYKLTSIAAFLLNKASYYDEAVKKLGVENASKFTWQNFTLDDWLDDIKNRIFKIQVALKKQKLEKLESRLEMLKSPELRAKMELENIVKELEG